MKLIALPLLAVFLLAGCSAGRTSPAAPASTVTVTAATPSASYGVPFHVFPITLHEVERLPINCVQN